MKVNLSNFPFMAFEFYITARKSLFNLGHFLILPVLKIKTFIFKFLIYLEFILA